MSHSYFGDSVVIRHFEHAWLKEGWASYMEACFLEDNRGKDEYIYDLYLKSKSYFSECQSYVRPIVVKKYNASFDIFDRHLYQGGAWRLHMLRKKLGFPKIEASYSYDRDANVISIKAKQTQENAKTGIELFAIGIPVLIVGQDDSKYESILKFNKKSQFASVAIFVKSSPKFVILDPEVTVLFDITFNPGTNILSNVLNQYPSVYHKIWASKQLIKIGTPQSLEIVRQAMRNKPFYGVISETAQFLSESKSALTLEVLLDLIDHATHPMAQAGIMLACASFRSTALRERLISFVKQENLPYRALSRAISAIGNNRNPDDFALLKSFAESQNPGGYIRIIVTSALTALGTLGTIESFNYLSKASQPGGVHYINRPAAINAFAAAGGWIGGGARATAIKTLEDYLLDPRKEIRKATVEGLVTNLTAKESLKALQGIRNTFSEYFQSWFDRKILTLSPKESTELNKKVEYLETKVLALEKEISNLSILQKTSN